MWKNGKIHWKSGNEHDVSNDVVLACNTDVTFKVKVNWVVEGTLRNNKIVLKYPRTKVVKKSTISITQGILFDL